jgi:hypothetical protein
LFNFKAEMKFTERQIIKAYGCSKSSVLDVVKDASGQLKLTYSEFLELLGRVAHEMFISTPEFHGEELHMKLDILLSRLAAVVTVKRMVTCVDAVRLSEIQNDHTGNMMHLVKKTGSPSPDL